MEITINDKKIDYEHASIMQMLDSAARIGRSADRDDIKDILKKVKEHIVIHFVDEEFIFTRQHPMPAEYVELHVNDHKRIQNEILLAIDTADLDSPDEIASLIREIREAISRHIREVDAQMNRYLPGGEDAQEER